MIDLPTGRTGQTCKPYFLCYTSLFFMDEERNRSNEQLIQPTYVLAPGYYPEPDPGEQLSLADYVRVLWRRRFLILATTLSCGLAALLVSQLLPRTYEAAATLLVQPPIFSTELRPAPLSVDTYNSIVDSDFVKSAVTEQMIGEGLIKANGEVDFSTEIFTSRIRDEGYSPVILLLVRAAKPEIALHGANLWADLAVRETAGLATRGKQGTLDFIQREYPTTRGRLVEQESALKNTEDSFDQQIRRAEDSWDSKIADFKTEWNLEVFLQQAKSLEARLTANVVALNELQLEIKETRDTLDELKEEIQQHPQFVVTSKAITDDALWERIGRDFQGDTASEIQNLRLRTEEINPVYRGLLQRLAETQVKFQTLGPMEQHLKDQIADQEREISRLNQLYIGKELELQKLVREKNTSLTLLKRERDFEVGALRREVEALQTSFETLAEKYETARLAQAEELDDVRVGAFAVKPENPVSPRPLLYTAIALAVGFMLSLLGAFMIEFIGSGVLSESQR